MPPNQQEQLLLNPPVIENMLAVFEQLADDLARETRVLLHACEEAERGDPHQYLRQGLEHNYEAIRKARIVEAQLRDVIRNTLGMLRDFQAHDQGVSSSDVAMSFTALRTIAADANLSMATIQPRPTPDTAPQSLTESFNYAPTVAIPHPSTTFDEVTVQAVSQSEAIDLEPPIAVEREVQVQVPPYAENMVVTVPPLNASLPAVTPTPTPEPMTPPAPVEITEENKSWWDGVKNFFGGLWNGLKNVGNSVLGVLEWLGKQLVNLVWGFIWGETAFDDVGGGEVVGIIGDVIAGVLIYGDIRDIVKYWIIYPLAGEGNGLFNGIMGGIAVAGFIPIFGDIGKPVVKNGLKQLLKVLGPELFEQVLKHVSPDDVVRLFVDLGPDGVKSLLTKLDPELVGRLLKDISPAELAQLNTDLGPHVLTRLSDGRSGQELQHLVQTMNPDNLAYLRSHGASITDGDVFVGRIASRNQTVVLPNISMQQITYIKRTDAARNALRNAFNSTVRKDFMINMANDPQEVQRLRQLGVSQADIQRMQQGGVPRGWQVHHKIPIDDGGTNDFDNLVLIKNDPYHIAVTNFQNSNINGLNPGDQIIIDFPVIEGSIYPPG